MTATAATGERGFRVGRVLGDSFRVLGANLLPFLTIALLLVAPVYLLRRWYALAEAPILDSDTFFFAATFVELLLGFTAEAAVVYGTFRQLQGRRPTFADTVATGLRKVLPVVLVSLVVITLMVLGFMLLVVPGLVVLTIYWVVVPAAVVENLGVRASLNRSANLTGGYRWRLSGIVLVVIALEIAAGTVIGLGSGVASDRGHSLVVEWLVSGAMTALYAVLATVSYRELRRAKEGAEVDEIAVVFD